MVFYLILCRSLTHAQRTAQALERAGIICHMMRMPKQIAAEGCGYCVKVSERWISRALVLLRQNELTPKQIYIYTDQDGYKEAEL